MPRPVYANEAALKSVSDYFTTLFQWDFQEGQISSEDYDYMSDSDLDDADSDALEHEGDSVTGKRSATNQGSSSESRGSAPDHSDSPEGKMKNGTAMSVAAEDAVAQKEPQPDAFDNPRQANGVGKPIVLATVAYKTLQAFVFWSLTGNVAFAPLRSQPSSAHLQHGSKSKNPYDPPECSSKSMYRFAHLCGNDELKKLALNNLTSKLTSSNVLIEMFSSLTARYPEVQEAEVAALVDDVGLTPEVLGALPQWLSRVASGELGPLSGDVVAKLIGKMARPGPEPSYYVSSPISAPASPVPTIPTYWGFHGSA